MRVPSEIMDNFLAGLANDIWYNYRVKKYDLQTIKRHFIIKSSLEYLRYVSLGGSRETYNEWRNDVIGKLDAEIAYENGQTHCPDNFNVLGDELRQILDTKNSDQYEIVTARALTCRENLAYLLLTIFEDNPEKFRIIFTSLHLSSDFLDHFFNHENMLIIDRFGEREDFIYSFIDYVWNNIGYRFSEEILYNEILFCLENVDDNGIPPIPSEKSILTYQLTHSNRRIVFDWDSDDDEESNDTRKNSFVPVTLLNRYIRKYGKVLPRDLVQYFEKYGFKVTSTDPIHIEKATE